MNYKDESVIKNLNEYKESVTGDIKESIYVKEDLYTFHREELFDSKVSVMLPDSFVDLPEFIKKLKYPSENRPQIIKTNKVGGINFAFSIVDIPFQNEIVVECRDHFMNTLKNINPSISFADKGEDVVNGVKLGWFEFQNHVSDGTLYNIMYYMPVEGKMLHGIFNCILQDMPLWKDIAFQVMKSVKDMTIVLDEEG